MTGAKASPGARAHLTVWRHYARLLRVGWLFHLTYKSRSLFEIVDAAVFPVLFASATFFFFDAAGRPGGLLCAAIGAGFIGIWDTTLFGSGGAIQEQRWLGTLELLVAAPTPLLAVIAPLTLASATQGIYAFSATLLWGWLAFGIDISIVNPLAFAVALPVTIISLGMLGIILASTFVWVRNANAFCNMLTFPMTLAAGLMIPLSILPGWMKPVSWVLAPTWGVQAVRRAALGGDPWPSIAMCLLLGAAYAVAGGLLLLHVERSALKRASLALA